MEMAGVVRTERSEGFKIAEANLLLPPEDTFMKACRSSSAMRSTVGGAVCASVFSAVSPSLCFSDVAGNPRFFSRSVTALGEGSGLDGCFVRLPKEPKNDIGALATDPSQPECLPLLRSSTTSDSVISDYCIPARSPDPAPKTHTPNAILVHCSNRCDLDAATLH